MIFSLILLLAIVVFLAFFIGFNISNTCTFWFFNTYTDISVTTVAFISFAAGIVVALLIVLIAKLKTPVQKEIVTVEKPAKDKNLKKEIKKIEAKNRKFKFGKKKADSSNEGTSTETESSSGE